MSNSFPKNKLLKNSVFISIAISLTMVLFFLALGRFEIAIIYRFIGALIFFLLICIFNVYLFLYCHNKNIHNRRLWFIVVSYSGSIVMWLISKYSVELFTNRLNEVAGKRTPVLLIVILSILCSNTLILIVQRLVISQYNESRKEIENISLKASLTNTSNLLLRQQLQPHFLFNALSAMKSLYKQNNQQGDEYLAHLASFLRESVINRTSQTVLVKEELDFCTHYMKMQEIRFGEAVHYSMVLSSETINGKYLPYFSLQPLIENAFKHNDYTEEMPLVIEILEYEDYILVRNTHRKRLYPPESLGNGLFNLSERYRLLGAPPIVIHSENDLFEVRLKLLNK